MIIVVLYSQHFFRRVHILTDIFAYLPPPPATSQCICCFPFPSVIFFRISLSGCIRKWLLAWCSLVEDIFILPSWSKGSFAGCRVLDRFMCVSCFFHIFDHFLSLRSHSRHCLHLYLLIYSHMLFKHARVCGIATKFLISNIVFFISRNSILKSRFVILYIVFFVPIQVSVSLKT